MKFANKIFKLLNKDGTRAIAIKYTGICLTFALQVAILKIWSTEHYGIYLQVLAWANVLGTLCAFGQMTYLTKNISILLTTFELKNIFTKAKHAFYLISACCCITYIAFHLVSIISNLAGIPGPFETDILTTLLYMVPLVAFHRAFSGLLRGSGMAISELTFNHLFKPLVQLGFLLIVAFALTEEDLSARLLVELLALSFGVIIVFQILRLCRHYSKISQSVSIAPGSSVNQNKARAPQLSTIIQHIRQSVTFTGLNVVTAVEKSVDIIIVGMVAGAEAAGIYGFVSRLYRISNTAQVSLNAVFASKAASSYASKEIDTFNATIVGITRINVANSLFFLLAYFAIGDWILASVRDELNAGFEPLIILSFFALIRSLAGPASMVTNMVGAENAALKITISTLISGAALTYLLTVQFGITGTAVGVSIMSVARAWLLYFSLKRVTNAQ